MPCYHPLVGYRSKERNPSGKRSIVFNRNQGFLDQEVTLPCGQCIGCRLERSRIWAIRCMHEASLYERNCFITLTFHPTHLPPSGSLDVRDFQLFMKRLRKRFGPDIRFFHCGEYGDRGGRPHYHACLFNFDFPDRKLWKTHNGVRYYVSQICEELWPFGFSVIGDVTFESAAYVARYITKKVTGERALLHYTDVDFATGEILKERRPEYVTMSRRPGIGRRWFDLFYKDVFPDDFVLMRGKKLKPPKFYNAIYEKLYPKEFLRIKEKRLQDADKHVENNTPNRRLVREEIQLLKAEQLKRSYEYDY